MGETAKIDSLVQICASENTMFSHGVDEAFGISIEFQVYVKQCKRHVYLL